MCSDPTPAIVLTKQTAPFSRLDRGLTALRCLAKALEPEAEEPIERHEFRQLLSVLSSELEEGLRDAIHAMDQCA